MKRALVLAMLAVAAVASAQPVEVAVTINTEQSRHAISPLIYGLNAYVYDFEWQKPEDWKVGLENHAPGLNVGSRRLGGNTMTGYNWENGFSNSGNDDNHSNNTFQSYITGAGEAPYAPGAALTTFHDHSLGLGAYSLLQLPAAGYVAADGNGAVSLAEAAPSVRWKKLVFDKPGSPGSLLLAPDPNDGEVYVDEELNFLIDRYGASTAARGIKGYELDNEPGLWHHFREESGNEGTHSRLHADLTTCGDILQRNIALAATVKRMDGGAEVYGPAMWGYPEYYSLWSIWDNAAGMSRQPSDWAQYNTEPYLTNNTGDPYRYNRMTWVNAYLDRMRVASEGAGKRLLDAFSFHYYPADEAVETDAKLVQAPRSLWDPTFVETSWITANGNGFTDGRSLELIPKMQRSIDDFYPGTKLAITEYSFGGRHSAAGGIAQADALGIFGRQGVHLANYFFTVDDYIAAAFRIYRNYDGKNSTFGDTSVLCTTSDIAASSAYAATGKGGNELHVIVINKSLDRSMTAHLTMAGAPVWDHAEVYAFGPGGSQIQRLDDIVNSGSGFNPTLPAATVAHLVFKKVIGSADEVANGGSVATIAVTPNPVSDRTMLRVDLPRASHMSVKLFDALGNEVLTLLDGFRSAGPQRMAIDAAGLAPGRYTVRMVAGDTRRVVPVVVVR